MAGGYHLGDGVHRAWSPAPETEFGQKPTFAMVCSRTVWTTAREPQIVYVASIETDFGFALPVERFPVLVMGPAITSAGLVFGYVCIRLACGAGSHHGAANP